jgi:hypothetical protein
MKLNLKRKMKMAITKKADAALKPVDDTIQDAADAVSTGDIVQADHETQELATLQTDTPANMPVVANAENAISSAIARLSAQFGDDVLEFDFTSFPILKLEKRNFELSNDERVGEEIKVVLSTIKAKYLFQSAHEDPKKREVVYSYDKLAHQRDPDIMDVIKKWKDEEQVDFTIKKYLEVIAVMVDDDRDHKMDGQIIMMQIPPKSVAKISGYVTSQEAGGRTMGSYITIVSAGKEVGHGQTAFFPWEFKFDRSL